MLRGARNLDALRFSEQKNAALLRAIPDGIFLVDTQGAISHVVSPIAGLSGSIRTSLAARGFPLRPEDLPDGAGLAAVGATVVVTGEVPSSDRG